MHNALRALPAVTDGMRKVRCRFGCDDPVAIVYAPEGCICWTDPVQALCAQHLAKIESTGEVIVLVKTTGVENKVGALIRSREQVLLDTLVMVTHYQTVYKDDVSRNNILDNLRGAGFTVRERDFSKEPVSYKVPVTWGNLEITDFDPKIAAEREIPIDNVKE